MSVGVKQPTQFQRTEFKLSTTTVKCPMMPRPIGMTDAPGSVSDGEGMSSLAPPAMRTRSKSVSTRPTSSNKEAELDDPRRQQQAFRRRRFLSHSHLHQRYDRGGHASQQIRRRRHSTKNEKEKIVLPTKFLLGGNINDPLNLNGLPSDNTEQATPVSSPLATPAHRRLPVNVIIPLNITDPLNLNCDDEELAKLLKKKKRIKHHKKKDSSNSLLSETSIQETPNPDVTKPLSIEIDQDTEKNVEPPKQESSKATSPPILQDKIVSPVIPQISPKRRRKRLSSERGECKPDSSSSAARNIFREDSDPKGDSISPSGSKYRRQHSGQSQDGQRSHQNQQPPNKKPRNSNAGGKFIYGNYNRYYGYRNPELEDNRLKCFKKDWFTGKDVLDIGCNVGHITLAIARYFEPNKITGIDIDGKLIGAARKNIKYYLPGQDGGDMAIKFPSSMKTCFGPISKKAVSEPLPSKFPKNVLFRQANYVLETDSLLDLQKQEYDVVLALSVTKWVHFNWGDDGLKRFFRRIAKQLRPGGILILEPQPWVSYKKKKKLTDTIFSNFQSIKFRPEHFRDYLLSSACGFCTCQFIDVPFNKNQGFRRPIQIYIKPRPYDGALPIEGRYSPMTPATPMTPHFDRDPFEGRDMDNHVYPPMSPMYPPMSPMQMPMNMPPMGSRLQYRRFSMPCPVLPRNSWSLPAMLSSLAEQEAPDEIEDSYTGHQMGAPCTISRNPNQCEQTECPAAAAAAASASHAPNSDSTYLKSRISTGDNVDSANTTKTEESAESIEKAITMETDSSSSSKSEIVKSVAGDCCQKSERDDKKSESVDIDVKSREGK
ncbi:7SK snRNA methylphosphate capping enzyme-like [Lineus longissimus]|uniref:7SK snRNA methylphosphate capping enzyme-like n=1 Tax=Lineus longissimus TaxID=88925 RepID=UPI002B4D630A